MNQVFNKTKTLFKKYWKLIFLIIILILFALNFSEFKKGFLDGYYGIESKLTINLYNWSKPQARFLLNIPLDKNKGGQKSVGADLTTIAKKLGGNITQQLFGMNEVFQDGKSKSTYDKGFVYQRNLPSKKGNNTQKYQFIKSCWWLYQ